MMFKIQDDELCVLGIPFAFFALKLAVRQLSVRSATFGEISIGVGFCGVAQSEMNSHRSWAVVWQGFTVFKRPEVGGLSIKSVGDSREFHSNIYGR